MNPYMPVHGMNLSKQIVEHWLERDVAHWVHQEGSITQPLPHEWTLYHKTTLCCHETVNQWVTL